MIVQHGGEYHADLTNSVTHLIAFSATGAKYKYAQTWQIPIVALEWLRDSLERGIILDETLYNITTPREERGKGAWIRRSSSTTSLGKRQREDGGRVASIPGEEGRRKLRRTTSKKLGSQNEGLWTDIVNGIGAPQAKDRSKWDEQADGSIPSPEAMTSFAVQNDSNIDIKSEPDAPVVELQAVPSNTRGIFQGRLVFCYGFSEHKVKPLMCTYGLNLEHRLILNRPSYLKAISLQTMP
jgi:hypothetical protein